MRALTVTLSLLLALIATACSNTTASLQASLSPASTMERPALTTDWEAASDTVVDMPAPAGVDATLWQRLTAALASELAVRSASQGVKPLTHPQFAVTDFTPTARDAEYLYATWTYRNPGDYDQNGEVNAGDLVFMAKHYKKTTSSPDWATAQLADGNGNGEVEFGDVTTLGQNYRNAISGYFLCVEWGDIDYNGERQISDITPLAARSQWTSNVMADFDGGPIFLCAGDMDTDIFKVENYGAPDAPGPWFPLTQLGVAAGTAPPNGDPLGFDASMFVDRAGQSQLTLNDRRICVLPYYDPPVADDPTEIGARSAFHHIPPRVHLDLGKVRSFMYQLQNLENQAEIDALAGSPYDLIVIDVTDTQKDFGGASSSAMVAQLKASPGTNVPNKIVLAYLNIGQAEDYRTYWEDGVWQPPTQSGPGNPDFIITNDPAGWPGNYPVAFWDPDWQQVIYGPSSSLLTHIQFAGFDGIYLDWVEAYQEPSVAAAAVAAGKVPAREMAYFIRGLRDSARNDDPDFIVIQQGAPELLADAGGFTMYPELPLLLPQVDGIGLEDIWFGGDPAADWGDPAGGDIAQDPVASAEMQSLLTPYRNGPDGLPGTYDDKLVLTIDYCLDPVNAAQVYTDSRALEFVPLVTQISLAHMTETPPPTF
jgi:cysteinyl-tRNA synthetase